MSLALGWVIAMGVASPGCLTLYAGVVGTRLGDRDGGGESGLFHVVRGCRWHWVG